MQSLVPWGDRKCGSHYSLPLASAKTMVPRRATASTPATTMTTVSIRLPCGFFVSMTPRVEVLLLIARMARTGAESGAATWLSNGSSS